MLWVLNGTDWGDGNSLRTALEKGSAPLCRCDDFLDLADFFCFVCVIRNAFGLSDLRGGKITVQSRRKTPDLSFCDTTDRPALYRVSAINWYNY
jgi:hypothetical protein